MAIGRREFIKRIGIVSTSLGLNNDEQEGNQENVSWWELQKDDIIIVTLPEYLCSDDIAALDSTFRKHFPDNKIILIDGRLEIKFVRPPGK